MDKLRTLYNDFFKISKEYLERETGACTNDPDFENDATTLMTLIPVLEKKVCPLCSSVPDDKVVLMMKYCNYQIFSFWFLKSGAVVKSVYNKMKEDDKSNFLSLFKNILITTQTLISLNNMYSNIRQDTADIVSDSKKIVEIVSQINSSTGDGNIHQILQTNYSFIVKTINKIFSDENYLLKLVSVFDSKLINDRQRLEDYRELLSVSTDSLTYGIQCISNVTIPTIDFEGNKFTSFFKKVLSNVILFQHRDLNSQRFISTVAKIYLLIYNQMLSNPKLGNLLREVMETVNRNVSVDEIKKKGVRNIQSLIKFIADSDTSYKSIVSEIYAERETFILNLMQEIVSENKIEYRGELLDVKLLMTHAKDNFFSKF